MQQRNDPEARRRKCLAHPCTELIPEQPHYTEYMVDGVVIATAIDHLVADLREYTVDSVATAAAIDHLVSDQTEDVVDGVVTAKAIDHLVDSGSTC